MLGTTFSRRQPSSPTPVLKNVNAGVDQLVADGVVRCVLAPEAEIGFSNSMIEAFWRSLRHQWLYLHSLESFTQSTTRRCHHAFDGQTPDEVYFDQAERVGDRTRPPGIRIAERGWRQTELNPVALAHYRLSKPRVLSPLSKMRRRRAFQIVPGRSRAAHRHESSRFLDRAGVWELASAVHDRAVFERQHLRECRRPAPVLPERVGELSPGLGQDPKLPHAPLRMDEISSLTSSHSCKVAVPSSRLLRRRAISSRQAASTSSGVAMPSELEARQRQALVLRVELERFFKDLLDRPTHLARLPQVPPDCTQRRTHAAAADSRGHITTSEARPSPHRTRRTSRPTSASSGSHPGDL